MSKNIQLFFFYLTKSQENKHPLQKSHANIPVFPKKKSWIKNHISVVLTETQERGDKNANIFFYSSFKIISQFPAFTISKNLGKINFFILKMSPTFQCLTKRRNVRKIYYFLFHKNESYIPALKRLNIRIWRNLFLLMTPTLTWGNVFFLNILK